jgi:hypothetical protein
MACDCDGAGTCSCSITGGLATTITGFGTMREPFIIDVAATVLTAQNTSSMTALLTGTGDIQTPYVLSLSLILSGWKAWTGTWAEYHALPVDDSATLYVVIP